MLNKNEKYYIIKTESLNKEFWKIKEDIFQNFLRKEGM